MMLGYKYNELLDYNLIELQFIIKAGIDKRLMERKEKAIMDYQQATLTASIILGGLGGSKDVPTVYQAYPNIFEKELQEEYEEKQRQERLVAGFMRFYYDKMALDQEAKANDDEPE